MGRCAADWPEHKLKLSIRPMTADDLPYCAALHRCVMSFISDHSMMAVSSHDA
jgi:hypothetical protein